MKGSSLIKGLYVITDSSLPFDELMAKTESILKGGARVIQYRDKTLSDDAGQKAGRATQLLLLCNSYDALFIVNDDVQLARELNIGLHIGKSDTPLERARSILGKDAMIGVSCYNDLDLARQAVDNGADYLAFGSFFPSPSKPEAVQAPSGILAKAQDLGLPIVAIGGITPENGAALVSLGTDALAVISGVYKSPNPQQAAEMYNHLFK